MRRAAPFLPLLLLAVAAAGPWACSRAHEREDRAVAARPPVPAAAGAAVPAANVAAAVGHSVDELPRWLGPPQALPAGFQDPVRRRAADAQLAFRPPGLTVVVSYDARTRHVLDLLVLGTDEDALLRRTGLLPGALAYLVLPVFAARRSTQLMGLRVVPRE